MSEEEKYVVLRRKYDNSELFRLLCYARNDITMKTLGRFLFRIRSYTPIPLIILLIIYARPSLFSFIIGFLIVVTGELLRIRAVGYVGATTRACTMGVARQLVTTGPYAYVRNPLYLGNFLLSLGICIIGRVYVPHVYWIILLFVLGYFIQYVPIILSEEFHLRQECGTVYEEYYAYVRRFIPRIRPYAHSSDHNFALRRALKSESRTFITIVLVVVLVMSRCFN